MSVRVVAGAVIRTRAGRPEVLAALRGPTMSTPNVWELPGGKVEPGESDEAALARELDEELGIRVEVGPHLGTSRTDHAPGIVLVAYTATLSESGPKTPVPTEHAALRWVDPSGLDALDWAPADRPLLASLRRVLRERGTVPSEDLT